MPHPLAFKYAHLKCDATGCDHAELCAAPSHEVALAYAAHAGWTMLPTGHALCVEHQWLVLGGQSALPIFCDHLPGASTPAPTEE